MIQAGTTFSKDVPPYIVVGGIPVAYGGVNKTMCAAYGIDEKTIKHLTNAYRLVFLGQTSVFDAINQIKSQIADSPEIKNVIRFLESTEKGIVTKLWKLNDGVGAAVSHDGQTAHPLYVS